jgi:hypothetical protein
MSAARLYLLSAPSPQRLAPATEELIADLEAGRVGA